MPTLELCCPKCGISLHEYHSLKDLWKCVTCEHEQKTVRIVPQLIAKASDAENWKKRALRAEAVLEASSRNLRRPKGLGNSLSQYTRRRCR